MCGVGVGASIKKGIPTVSFGKDPGPLSLSASHDHMPMVLHSIISPTREEPCYESPLVAMNPVGCEEPLFLFFCEWSSVDPRIKLVKPSQSTALSYK